MIIFTVPKPFKGKFDVIQNNAIDSWIEIKPRPKIILLGDEEGITEMARRKKLIQIKNIKRDKQGTPLLNDIFAKIQKKYKNEVFMYINTDIILMNSPLDSINILCKNFKKFVAIGKRYEIQIEERMTKIEILKNIEISDLRQKSDSWMDYFIFTSGIFEDIPPFAIGKTFWDKWLVWWALQKKIPVVNITDNLQAIHQSHTYVMNKKMNHRTVWAGEQTINNLRLAGGWSHAGNISDATFVLINNKLNLCHKQKKNRLIRIMMDKIPILWPFFLEMRFLRELIDSKTNRDK
jgi:hypothetical protein